MLVAGLTVLVSSPVQAAGTPTLSFRGHVQNIGWQPWVTSGRVAGTTGRGLRLEALQLKLDAPAYPGSSVSAWAHVQNIGWMDPVTNGGVVGTLGRSLRVEELTLNLQGPIGADYQIYYRAHVEGIGWTGWASDGELAGTSGWGLRIEALEVRLIPYGAATPAKSRSSYDITPAGPEQFGYSAHVESIGWQPYVDGGVVAGTYGRGLRMEAIQFRRYGLSYDGGISATAHVQNLGWIPQVPSNANWMVGTQGRGLRMEALTLALTGELAKHYDVYYTVHVQNLGWLGWAKNGERAGSAGYGYRMEAFVMQLVPKGGPAPGGVVGPAFRQAS